MAGTFTCLNYHIVFSTKDRQPLIDAAIQNRLHEYLGGIVRGAGGVLYQIGGMPDHVHLLARLHPNRALSELLRDLKSCSTGWVKATFKTHRMFQWQEGYGAFTVSKSDLPGVSDYIARQTEHHAQRDFKSEFVQLLKAHGVEYDAQYIWT